MHLTGTAALVKLRPSMSLLRGLARVSFALVCFSVLVPRSQAQSVPTITSFSPTAGPVGNTVVISGTNFVPPLSITFAGNAQSAGSFTSTQITVTVPAGAETGPITLMTGGGTVSTATAFTVGTAALPVVTLTTSTPKLTLGSGEAGVFTLAVPTPSVNDVVVAYTIGGTAVNGTDYAFLKGTAKIKVGKTSKNIIIDPMGNLGGASKVTIKLTLAQGQGYSVGTTTAVKVKIVAGQ